MAKKAATFKIEEELLIRLNTVGVYNRVDVDEIVEKALEKMLDGVKITVEGLEQNF